MKLLKLVLRHWRMIFQSLLVITSIILPFTQLSDDVTIIGLLLIIAGEYYWNSIMYSEKILCGIQDIRHSICGDNVVLQKNRTDFSIEDEIQKAKHNIFISGSTLQSMFQSRDILSRIPDNIILEIIYTDFSKPELLSAFRLMVGYDLSEDSLSEQFKLGQRFCNYLLERRPNTKIKKVDYIMPIVYVGIDCYNPIEPSTIIRAKHYLNNSNADGERFIIAAKHGTEYFNIYKRQIDSILETAKKHN